MSGTIYTYKKLYRSRGTRETRGVSKGEDRNTCVLGDCISKSEII